MHAMTLRLSPGDDLRAALDHAFRTRALSAAFVLQGIGSLSVARYAMRAATKPQNCMAISKS